MTVTMGARTIRGLEEIFIFMLRKCNKVVEMRIIHAQMEKLSLLQSNLLVTRMLDICDQNGVIDYASSLFKQVVEPNTFLYNSMIKAYTHAHMYPLTISVYKQMIKHSQAEEQIIPDRFTYPFVARSCGGLLDIVMGRQIHGHVYKFGLSRNSIIESSLLDMYAKCDAITEAHMLFDEMGEKDVISWNSLISGHVKLGRMDKARALFEEMPIKSIVSWTAMITGYTKTGCFGDALDVFRRMQIAGVAPDWISLVVVLPACAQLGALELGKWIHFYADKKGFLRNTSICNALMEMYSKCGCVDQAQRLFNKMSKKDVVSWSTMIVGLAHHGSAHEAIKLFQDMLRAKVEPNEITFVGLLSACAHVGLVDEGLKYFDSMKNDYNIEPEIEHYGCLVDLLGRTGNFDRALKLISSMKTKPDSAIWGSLLSSCRIYRNLEIAVLAMEHLLAFEPEDTGNLVLLANIYADLGKWDGVSKMRKLIRCKSMKKSPGCSLIEINNLVQEFVSADDSKPFSKDIYRMLDLLAYDQVTIDGQIDIMLELL